MPEEAKNVTEECKVAGEDLLREVKRLFHEGNVTHIVIKNEAGHKVIEIPVTVGVVGAVFLPVWAAVGAIAALAANYTIEVTRKEDPPTSA